MSLAKEAPMIRTRHIVWWMDKPIVDGKPHQYQLSFISRDVALAFATARMVKNSDLTIEEDCRVYSDYNEVRFSLILMPVTMRRCRARWVAGILTGPNSHRVDGARCIHNGGHEGDHGSSWESRSVSGCRCIGSGGDEIEGRPTVNEPNWLWKFLFVPGYAGPLC